MTTPDFPRLLSELLPLAEGATADTPWRVTSVGTIQSSRRIVAGFVGENDEEDTRYPTATFIAWCGSHRSEIIAALRIAAGAEWQPIETAPKDGTPILITGFFRDVHGMHIDDRYFAVAKYLRVVDGSVDGGWIEGGIGPAYHDPTHWMPLRSPPMLASAPLPDDGEAVADD